jgi:hypothetical protein
MNCLFQIERFVSEKSLFPFCDSRGGVERKAGIIKLRDGPSNKKELIQ